MRALSHSLPLTVYCLLSTLRYTRSASAPRVPMQVFQSRVVPVVCALALAAGIAHVSAQQTLSKHDAARFAAKLAQIEKNALTPRKAGAARSTQVTDAELNAYFRYLAGPQIPVGIAEPEIRGVGDGRLTGRALVDLDAVRTQKKRGWM